MLILFVVHKTLAFHDTPPSGKCGNDKVRKVYPLLFDSFILSMSSKVMWE